MKKLVLFFAFVLVSLSISAQFVIYEPVPDPPRTDVYIPPMPDTYLYHRRVPKRHVSSIPNNISGITLGVTGQQETLRKLQDLGFRISRSGRSGYFGDVVTVDGCKHEESDFTHVTFRFYKDRLWSITFDYCQSDPQTLADRLENKYSDYSISDTDYEYKDGDVILTFDGQMLCYQSNTVLTQITKGAQGR